MYQNQEIYEHALALLALGHDPNENEDFAEQAPYHLAAFCGEAEETDRWLRLYGGIGSSPDFNRIRLPLEDDFPLCDRLAPVAALYLAAMLILDEDPDRSQFLYERYGEALSDVHNGIPATLESIKNIYF
ncbi:MAG: hypothetical protein IKA76_01140 [Clostridia bacterium]|nr:hypothetical protein [Clostridia bacterium]